MEQTDFRTYKFLNQDPERRFNDSRKVVDLVNFTGDNGQTLYSFVRIFVPEEPECIYLPWDSKSRRYIISYPEYCLYRDNLIGNLTGFQKLRYKSKLTDIKARLSAWLGTTPCGPDAEYIHVCQKFDRKNLEVNDAHMKKESVKQCGRKLDDIKYEIDTERLVAGLPTAYHTKTKQ